MLMLGLSPTILNELLTFMESAHNMKNIRTASAQPYIVQGIIWSVTQHPSSYGKIIEILEDEDESDTARKTAYGALYVITGGDLNGSSL